jgi:hypothetical protein
VLLSDLSLSACETWTASGPLCYENDDVSEGEGLLEKGRGAIPVNLAPFPFCPSFPRRKHHVERCRQAAAANPRQIKQVSSKLLRDLPAFLPFSATKRIASLGRVRDELRDRDHDDTLLITLGLPDPARLSEGRPCLYLPSTNATENGRTWSARRRRCWHP